MSCGAYFVAVHGGSEKMALETATPWRRLLWRADSGFEIPLASVPVQPSRTHLLRILSLRYYQTNPIFEYKFPSYTASTNTPLLFLPARPPKSRLPHPSIDPSLALWQWPSTSLKSWRTPLPRSRQPRSPFLAVL